MPAQKTPKTGFFGGFVGIHSYNPWMTKKLLNSLSQLPGRYDLMKGSILGMKNTTKIIGMLELF
jgi:hypothetical protein